jgi:hypothetical protein
MMRAPDSKRRCARARKRCTPSTLCVLQTLTSRSGPMNISYRRSESAPYWKTTSSGLMTLPRDLDILCARACTAMAGLADSTKESPFFSISSAATASDTAPAGIAGASAPTATDLGVIFTPPSRWPSSAACYAAHTHANAYKGMVC